MSLKEQRKKAGLSQSQLAAISGVNLSMIQHYEQGVKNIDKAQLDTLCSLALATNSKLYEILEDKMLQVKVKQVL